MLVIMMTTTMMMMMMMMMKNDHSTLVGRQGLAIFYFLTFSVSSRARQQQPTAWKGVEIGRQGECWWIRGDLLSRRLFLIAFVLINSFFFKFVGQGCIRDALLTR